jgi:hypothetical protein
MVALMAEDWLVWPIPRPGYDRDMKYYVDIAGWCVGEGGPPQYISSTNNIVHCNNYLV